MKNFQKHRSSILALSMGITMSWVFSHPSSSVKRRLPDKSIKNIYYFPNLKIRRKKHHYHVHHWMYFGLFWACLTALKKRFVGKKIFEGFILGLVIHGLSYRDRFEIKKEVRAELLGY